MLGRTSDKFRGLYEHCGDKPTDDNNDFEWSQNKQGRFTAGASEQTCRISSTNSGPMSALKFTMAPRLSKVKRAI